ncbi:MAG: L,D-transpeptidase, partial [Acidobacteria bacterium]|nr:L,D-transpeptidase [Acidobacteriota bacterium]
MQRRSNLDSKILLAKRAFATVIFILFALRGSRAQQATLQTGDNESGRKIVVSIAHRTLALVEDVKVEKIYEVAVGA